MTFLHFIAILMVMVSAFAFIYLSHTKQSMSPFLLVMFFGLGLLLRMVLGYYNLGHPSDTSCWAGWADRVYSVGFQNFYSREVFTDYPPGYMYVLYLLGMIRSVFRIQTYCGIHLLLLKMPPIICDIICSLFLYKEACKKQSQTESLILASLYLFNPAIILNSSVWGQVDSIYTLGILFLCYFISQDKLIPAYITFGIGILIKPQTLIFTPVLLTGIIDQVFLQDFSFPKFFRHLFSGLSVIAGMILLCIPFRLEKVLAQYVDTLGSYPYITVNGFNFWALLGKNFVSQSEMLGPLSYQNWSTLILIVLVLATFIISFLLGKDCKQKYFLLAAFLILTMFHFSVRMHDRYLYAGLILVFLCYIYKPQKSLFLCYVGLSVFHWYNTSFILFFYSAAVPDKDNPAIRFISAGNVFFLLLFYDIIRHHYLKEAIHDKLQKCA